MPRGVAMQDAREQLFAAAERVLARDGPAGLTSRAVTDEAGVAKGLIYRHFADLDEFLAELTATWVRAAAGTISGLPGRGGRGSLRGNLASALLALFGPDSPVPRITALVASRPALAPRIDKVVSGASVLGRVEESLQQYLTAEQRLGRLSPGTDTRTAATVLLGAAHHLVFTGRASGPGFPGEVERIVGTVLSGLEADQPPDHPPARPGIKREAPNPESGLPAA
jgi:AcrR family transcriptional regulator